MVDQVEAEQGLVRYGKGLLQDMLGKAAGEAIQGIAELVGEDIEVGSVKLRQIPAIELRKFIKAPSGILIGVGLNIQGDATGNILLVYNPEVAFGLVDKITGRPSNETSTLDGMGDVLGEMGNIVGSFFLNSLSNDTGMRLIPSPPVVMVHKAEKIMDFALQQLPAGVSSIFITQSQFRTSNRKVNGDFLVVSTAQFLEAIVRRHRSLSQVCDGSS